MLGRREWKGEQHRTKKSETTKQPIPAKPTKATKTSLWPMPKGCVNGDAEAEPHIFVGGLPEKAPKDKK